jgi:hypothetical protein
MPKVHAFRFHFNRINMQRGKEEVWSVHTQGRCIQTKEVRCFAPIESRFKPTAKQPRAYFVGRGVVKVTRDVVLITED